jgi:hypothetical protein
VNSQLISDNDSKSNQGVVDLYNQGLTTAYHNYLSGEFFKQFFGNLSNSDACYLSHHLKSLKSDDRLLYFPDSKTGTTNYRKVKIHDELRDSLNKLRIIFKPPKDNVILNWVSITADGTVWQCDKTLFQVKNREFLEHFLLHLRNNFTKANNLHIIDDPKLHTKATAFDTTKRMLEVCMQFPISNSDKLELLKIISQ